MIRTMRRIVCSRGGNREDKKNENDKENEKENENKTGKEKEKRKEKEHEKGWGGGGVPKISRASPSLEACGQKGVGLKLFNSSRL